MKVLVVADTLDKIKPKSDTTLVLVRELLRRGHKVFWALDKDLKLICEEVAVSASSLFDSPVDHLPKLERAQNHFVREMDAVFIRKDPPFNDSYVSLCWCLALVENAVWMMNRPSLLLRYHEKLIPWEAYVQGFLKKEDLIPTFLGAVDEAQAYMKEHSIREIVTKPFFGYGGHGVQRKEAKSFLKSTAEEALALHGSLIQPFQKEIVRGDRRVFFLEGNILAHYSRVPKEGDFLSNLAQGGSAVLKALPPKESAVLKRLGKFLKSAGIHLAGADLIGPRVSEVNITSPTGLKSLLELEGKDYAHEIIDFVEHQISL